jgi:hypothetical protein
MSTYLVPTVDGYTRSEQRSYIAPRCSDCWSRTVVLAWVLVDLPSGSEDRRPRAVPKRRCTNEDCGAVFER